MEEYCICRHTKDSHIEGFMGSFNVLCIGCAVDILTQKDMSKPIHSGHIFKLDNLRFVEDEAKRRNLI
jgi:hypothetical protein